MEDDELRRLFGEMRREFTAVRQETAAEFAKARQETAAQFTAVRQETAAQFAAVRQENEQTRIRLDTLIVKTETGFEGVNHKIDLLADSFLLVYEKLEREAAEIRAETRQSFADTHALIRFVHSDLDRRAK